MQQFLQQAHQKVEKAVEPINLEENNTSNIVRIMRIHEDVNFRQLLSALRSASEHSLPSLLDAILSWYSLQHSSSLKEPDKEPNSSSSEIFTHMNNLTHSNSDLKTLSERRDLAIDVLFCQVLSSILKQLPLHPGHDTKVRIILDHCFTHFRYKNELLSSHNKQNINEVAAMYAKVVGVIAQSRFQLVKQAFMQKLDEFKGKESTSKDLHSIIPLILGLQSFRVNMYPIEDFVNCFQFLQDLARYFLYVREREVKHALARLFVEILVPVVFAARYEINIPALKNFVNLLYQPCFEMSSKKKHLPYLLQMTTCILCVSTKQFFLAQLPNLMSICINQIKNRDQKFAKVGLESLYCLLWVYVVRFKCEKHSDTQQKLNLVVGALFPKGSKILAQKETDYSVLVEIIKVIAQEKLEFAVREIIFELIGANKLQKFSMMPERMTIGLNALLAIASQAPGKVAENGSAQQHQVSNPYGRLFGVLPAHQRRLFSAKETTHDNMIPEVLQPYINQVHRAFEMILRSLDNQVCRSMVLANPRDEDVDRTQKILLLKTCVQCIPRIIPDTIEKQELVELLTRMTMITDEEIKYMAQQAILSLISEIPSYRVPTLQGEILQIY
ncbi:hypothetical protein Ciccas_001834 [Cichlidogyrus casuarinus]|uniref:Cell morphogenesis protein N-terminal domain-containing protein n=1 Tax=Cichlidogyrus casuarinus TaxID=1844966 RepID=A0ABD2QL77_9PLAT